MEYNVKGLNLLSKQFNKFVVSAGFDNNDVPLRIALIHSEISEAFEAFRKDKYADLTPVLNETLYYVNSDIPCCEKDNIKFKLLFEEKIKDSFEDEIADSIIRLLDLCGKLNIDNENHIKLKMAYNETRGFKYGGKKF